MDPRTGVLLEAPITRTQLRPAVPSILVLGAQAANLVRLVIAAAGGFVALRWTSDLSQVFLAQSAGLAAFGLINVVSVAGGAWFGRLHWPTRLRAVPAPTQCPSFPGGGP